MPREKNTEITLPTYQKHWVHTRPYGHDIVIWCDTGKTTIKCIWPDRNRSDDGRVKTKKSGSETTSNLEVSKSNHKRQTRKD